MLGKEGKRMAKWSREREIGDRPPKPTIKALGEMKLWFSKSGGFYVFDGLVYSSFVSAWKNVLSVFC